MRKETYLLTTKNIFYKALMLHTKRRSIKHTNVKFLHDVLVNWLYFITLLFLWWAITVELVLKGTFIERPSVYKDHWKILWISSLYTQSAYMYFCCLKKDVISYPKYISAVKKRQDQVTEWLKGGKSLWGQEEKIYQQGCVELQHTKQVK